ncbi:MAG: polyprenyl synthetase family protein [Fimbriiglobus sp.]
MQLPLLTLPRAVPVMAERPPQDTIPGTREGREAIRVAARKYTERVKPVLPLSFEELKQHADQLISEIGSEEKFRDYIAVIINSEASRDALAAVPFERRLLLLPKCLRVEDRCPAPFDEFGLLCKQCGLCTIQDLQNEAEKLGYAVLVAEGSALVMAIIQTGKIDAILGVSCLSVLEKAFPYMESAAIPGVAVPLLQDDCKDTTIDIEWVWDFLHSTSDDRTYRLDLDAIRQEVDEWFTLDALTEILGEPSTETERIGHEWLSRAGKRWRPFLAVCVWKALQEDPECAVPKSLREVAIAVECFHKASLAHDDIQDADDLRYGEPTLFAQHGMPIALNVGDYLLGEGYRLLAACDVPANVRADMVRIAAEGHRTLCLGQGEELAWVSQPRPLTPSEVVSIHSRKTSPAFEVALRLGATLAQGDASLHPLLSQYSQSLGIAYQIRDDLEDITSPDGDDITAGRLSLPLALAYERAKGEDRNTLAGVWQRQPGISADDVRSIMDLLGATERSEQMLESYKEQAIRILMDVQSSNLKGLLRRVVSKIFSVEIQGWCHEFEARNAAGRPAVLETAGGVS